MAEEILDKIRDVAEGEIDFQGQRTADLVSTLLLTLSGFIALNIGYVKQDIVLAMYVGLAGTVLTFLVVVPPWPFFKSKPVKWLPAGYGVGAG